MSKDTPNTVTYSVGPGLCTLLTVLFVGLKLTGYIGWSWWWVLLPAYGPLTLVLGVMILCFLVFMVAWGVAGLLDRWT